MFKFCAETFKSYATRCRDYPWISTLLTFLYIQLMQLSGVFFYWLNLRGWDMAIWQAKRAFATDCPFKFYETGTVPLVTAAVIAVTLSRLAAQYARRKELKKLSY